MTFAPVKVSRRGALGAGHKGGQHRAGRRSGTPDPTPLAAPGSRMGSENRTQPDLGLACQNSRPRDERAPGSDLDVVDTIDERVGEERVFHRVA